MNTEHCNWFFPANRAAVRATVIAVVINVLYSFSGFYVTIVYATDIFIDTKSDMNPIHSSILIEVTIIVGNIVALYLIARVDRRCLYVSSSIFLALGFAWFALYAKYLMPSNSHGWMGAASLCFAIFVGNMGVAQVPFIVSMDIFPRKVSSDAFDAYLLPFLLLSRVFRSRASATRSLASWFSALSLSLQVLSRSWKSRSGCSRCLARSRSSAAWMPHTGPFSCPTRRENRTKKSWKCWTKANYCGRSK